MMLDIAGDSTRAHDRVAADPRVKRLLLQFSLGSLKLSLLATTAICAVMVLARPASAQSPTGGSVVAGTAGISQAGAVTNINQSSQKAIINWQGFSVGAQNTVNFNQPNSSSATLNRVIGNERSVIDGAINANGQVFIVNSAGVLFGKGAQVNVGGLVASTLDISNNDFMAGNYKFSGNSSASVVNQGRIRAHGGGQGGGYVALLGKTVSNEGVISAKLGTVAMAAGEKITLNFGGDSLLDVTIDKGTLNALVQNKRAIIANGGQVIMTAKAADQVLSAQVNNSGIIQARTMAALKGGSNGGGTVKIGKIKLLADGGTTNVSGKLDASAPKGGDGGFIETSGDHVNIADSAVITTLATYGKTGTWLIDPNDFTVAASGGNMTGAAVAAALLSNNFEIKTATMGTPGGNGDIFVNDAITWSSNNTLTLTAERDININQKITATGASAGLVFTAANNININNAVRLDGASATLAMTYGGNYNIRTPASYAGTTTGPIYDKDGNPVYGLVLVQKVNPPLDDTGGTKATYGALTPGPVYDADGNPVYELVPGGQATGPVAMQDTSGGVYGSITFTNSANAHGLIINGQTYTLIHDISQLDLLDKRNSSGMSYNPNTGLYDVSISSVAGTIVARKAVVSGTNYYNPATNAYDIAQTSTAGTCGSATCYYNPDSRRYDRTAVYVISAINQFYYYDPATRQYSIAMYNGSNYYDPASPTPLTYTRTTAYTSTMVYDPTRAEYFAQLNASNQYYNPATGTYQATRVTYPGTLYYDPISGLVDLTAPYAVTGNYALATNIDAGGTSYDYSVVGALGAGSIFTGLGHTIDKLTITGSAGIPTQTSGLFGTVTSSTLRDLGLTNVDINVSLPYNTALPAASVGALAGSVVVSTSGTILPSIVYNVYSTGTVTSGKKDANGNWMPATGFGRAGGLIGNDQGNSNTPVINTVTNAFSTVNVLSNNSTVGGLIGSANSVALANAYATGNVQGNSGGGLAGGVSGTVSNSYATGTVTVVGGGGGLLGSYSSIPSLPGNVSNSFATGDVFGGAGNGGLIGTVGFSNSNVAISNVYATGDVHANSPNTSTGDPPSGEGGLIGIADSAASTSTHLTITNAHAYGDVIADIGYSLNTSALTGAFGGLVGQFYDAGGGSLIKDSYATGTVDSSRAANVQPTGGLVGRATAVNIEGSYSTGAVLGDGIVGGLAGMFMGGGPRGNYVAAISSSWTTSTVTLTGPVTRDTFVGGLIGQAAIANIGSSVFYNGENAGGAALGNAQFFNQPGAVNNSQGLTGNQLADARFYANGTINQVLAGRAFEAASVQAAAQAAAEAAAARQADLAQGEQGAHTANAVTSNTQNSSETPPDSASANAGASAAKTAKSAAVEESVKSVDDAAKADDTWAKHERERERRRTAQTSHRGHAGSGTGGGLGATIRSIDVNGQRFNLENGAPKQDAPAQPPH